MNKNYSFNLGKNIGRITGKYLKLTDKVVLGDGIIYLSPTYEKLGGGYINKIDINGKRDNKFANPGDTILLKDVPRGSKYVFKSYSKEVNDDVENRIKKENHYKNIDGYFKGKIGEVPKLTLKCQGATGEIYVTEVGENPVEKASKKALTHEEIKDKISQLGDTTFILNSFDSDIDENIFLPVSVLKNLKRECAKKLEDKLVESYRRKAPEKHIFPKEEETTREVEISAIVSNKGQEKVLRDFGIKKNIL